MSPPAPGNYYIVNTVPDAFGGQKLAVTYDGIGRALTVDDLDTTNTAQVWSIRDYNSTQQLISPLDDAGVQAAIGNGYITALPAKSYTWVLTKTEDDKRYTIQDGHKSIFWFLEETSQGANVTYENYPDSETHYWWLYNY